MAGKTALYVHIGMGKTGTTALQHFFSQNREVLLARGVDYPDYHLIEGAHHRISPHVPPFLAHHWKFLKVGEWAPELQDRDKGSLLLSSELISSARPDVVAQFGKEIRDYFDVRIIIYFRRQDHLITSAYNQQIKAGTLTAPFDQMLERQFPSFDFVKKLAPWVDAFGKDNIIVVPYERVQFHEQDIRKDFLKRIFGIEDFDGFVFEGQERNPALGYSAAEFKRLVNCVIRNTDMSSFFNEVLFKYSTAPEGGGSQSKLSPAPAGLRAQILKRCEASNQVIARDFLGRSDGKLFLEPEPTSTSGGGDVVPEFTEDELVRIIRFVREHEPELIDVLKAGIDEAAETDRFEAYFAGKKLEAGLAMSENKGFEERQAPFEIDAPVVTGAYAMRKGSVSDARLKWLGDKEFELGGCRFTIDLTAGSKRRISEPNNFTIVKTRKFLGSYLDIPLEEGAKILELGIFQGGSLAFMERLYKPSRIVGIDLTSTPVDALELYKADHPSVATYYGVSQDDERKVSDIIQKEFSGSIDMVVDDASHLYEQTRKSFQIVFPFLKPGGLYVIEDWAWSFRPAHQQSDSSWYNKAAMANLIFELVADIGGNTAIESMFIHENLAIFRKSAAPNAVAPLAKMAYRNRKLQLI